jgi:hypothetical protein
MKLRPIAERNLLGLNTPDLKFHYGLHTLIGATLPNVSQTVIKPATPATAAIIGTGTAQNPQFPAVPARGAIKSPIVRPLPDWAGSVVHYPSLVANPDIDRATLYLPYSPAAIALGVELTVAQIQEITPPTFDLGVWQGDLSTVEPASESEFLVNGVIGTVEQFVYANALLLTPVDGYTNKIEKTIYKPHPLHNGIAAIMIDIYTSITASNYQGC